MVAALAFLGLEAEAPLHAGGVTVITHGFNGNVDDWVLPMAARMIDHPGFPGTSASCYILKVVNQSGPATVQWVGGVTPDLTDSGEIFIKLDWSAEAGLFGGSSSGQVAQLAVAALLNPALIPATGGRALAELPLHLVGHSRGASVVTEMARRLGEQGVWVDHVTTLDPIPVTLLGDAAVRNWQNVLYADNFWQNIGAGDSLRGSPLAGAFNRELLNLNGANTSSHSDVHLWYHGTIELGTPAQDAVATITATERAAWWTAEEAQGANTGYRFSRIGGGDRLSDFRPAGTGTAKIRDGFNGVWDLGGDIVANRTALSSNSGLWPNVIRCGRTTNTSVPAGGSFGLTLHYQAGANSNGQVSLSILLDPDRNPWNGNEVVVNGGMLATTGTSTIGMTTVTVNTAGIPPGIYTVAGELSDGIRTRSLYAADAVEIMAPPAWPVIDRSTVRVESGKMRFSVMGQNGQTVEVRASEDLVNWSTVATQVLSASVWEYADDDTALFPKRYYRVRKQP